MFTIKSPVEGLNLTTFYGPTTLTFKDGVAEVEEITEGLKTYLEGAGYEVSEGLSEAESFDPAKHTAAEVQEYLATADDEETARVVEAEKAGKDRSTLLSAIEKAREEKEESNA